MPIYLPIAEVSVDLFILLGLGFSVGILSGMFGVGGGFLITPILFLMGVPPAVAVATQANQIVATSLTAVFVHLKNKSVDIKMGLILLGGGLVGSFLGVRVFNWMSSLGQIEFFVTICYIFFLGMIGSLMLIETIRAIRRKTDESTTRSSHTWVHRMPFKVRFRTSKMYISAIPVISIGLFVGFLAAILGVGGGFIMVPAMIYILGMPTKTVIGTSLFQILFVTAFTTIMHAINTQTVDLMLAIILIIGSVPGAQLGAVFATRLSPLYLRFGMASVVLLVAIRLLLGLLIEPTELYSVQR